MATPLSLAQARAFSYLNERSSRLSSTLKVEPQNSQSIDFLEAAVHSDPNPAKGGGDITIVDDSALLPDSGPTGTISDVSLNDHQGKISLYTVRAGDTLPAIAKMFDVSMNTIAWANDIDTKSALREGQTLIILPLDGVQHTVKKGDTLGGIAKRYSASVDEIIEFNSIPPSHVLSVGDVLVVPHGKEGVASHSSGSSQSTARRYASLPSYSGYYTHPVPDGHKTQGIHGYNGVDYGAAVGTPVYAAADGLVVVSRFRAGGNPWFGGYGNYVVIEHLNGTQTLYGHMSDVLVATGTHVTQGQQIGAVGNTGHSTGPHLHFEVRGAKNPF